MARKQVSDAVDEQPMLTTRDIDATYRVYDEHPLDEPDAWGDLASFRTAVACD